MAKFQSHYKPMDTPRGAETLEGIDMTIPNQSMTPRELLYRFAHGLSLDAMKIPVFNEGKDMDLSSMDYIDVMEAVQEQRDRVQKLKEKAEADIKERKEKAVKMKQQQIFETTAAAIAERRKQYDQLRAEFEKPNQ